MGIQAITTPMNRLRRRAESGWGVDGKTIRSSPGTLNRKAKAINKVCVFGLDTYGQT
jgi:hypothetical protein